MDTVVDVGVAAVVAAFLANLAAEALESVDYMFIDEVFHFRQLGRYLRGDWTYWDPKITTPPGLYALTWAYMKGLGVAETLANARHFNLLGGCFIGACCIIMRMASTQRGFTAGGVMMNPLLVLYYALYYTDVWSAALVVAMYTLVVVKPVSVGFAASMASMVGTASLAMRQTNIVWCIYCLGVLIDGEARPLYRRQSWVGDLSVFVRTAMANAKAIVPFGLVGVLFVTFLIENGGVALGDKTNHVAVPHVAQLFYCCAFIACFTAPLWVSARFFKHYVRDNFASVRMVLFNVVWVALLAVGVHSFTVVHPFVLADNRHYTFYIVRRFIWRSENSRYQLIPLYHLSFYAIYTLFKECDAQVLFCGWILCTAATIVPSPLFEPRYYIVPYILLRLAVGPVKSPLLPVAALRKYNATVRLGLELVWFWLWARILYMVFHRITFQWEGLADPQRIIW